MQQAQSVSQLLFSKGILAQKLACGVADNPPPAYVEELQHRISSKNCMLAPVKFGDACRRLVYGADNDIEREVRISCPDATGLGCDVTRMLLDFGLRIVHGDMSTDGKWCFLIFRVHFYCVSMLT